MEDRRGKMGRMFAIVMFVGMAVTGVAAGAGMNETLADGNGHTTQLLMASSTRVFTVESCVESFGRNNGFSFPPRGFVPPGAEEWCA